MTATAGQIKAVVFDVGRVLIEWDLRLLYARLIDDADEVDWFTTNVVSEDWHHQHDQGRDLAEMIAERKREFPRHADLIDAYATRFAETIPGPVAGTHDLVRRLCARGVALFGITNFADKFWSEYRPTEPLFDLFGDIVVSGVEKVAKPEPRIYAIAVERFGHQPGEMLFIDDNATNIAAARKLGWHVHRFTCAAALEADLKLRGLIG